ncbi:hypothetical protein GCK72_015179 [Caenorhabditis remanei]|uniref:Uncharacterized protein n=1 Tax=Caenorhabditis remanei TaxID=31234 RepID=A0A6A5GVY9_CAERE|nr:hypothetical protein GCK72_015179 [Caenorhabditis remanei]KAF1758719.1 hypothetical protein GCK72_015179 [Caenorhabditis remanei]
MDSSSLINCEMENQGQKRRYEDNQEISIYDYYSDSAQIETLEFQRLKEENEAFRKENQMLKDSEWKLKESLKCYELMADRSCCSGTNLEKDEQIENLKKEMEELKSAFWKSLAEQIRMKKDLEESEETRKDAERAILMLHEQLAKERARSASLEQELEEEIEDLVEKLEKSDEALKEVNKKMKELEDSSYRFKNRQVKRKLFKEMDDALEFGDDEEEEEVKKKIKIMDILFENRGSDDEL